MSLFDVRTQNRQTVIESALDCFIKDGIEDTKIAYIARCAGLTERSVYRYFENKADLVLQAVLFFGTTISAKSRQSATTTVNRKPGLTR